MAFKRRGEPATIDDEREALRAQRAALEDLKRQLAERVEAVRERELELHHALAEASSPLPETGRVSGPSVPAPDRWEAETGEVAQRNERNGAAPDTGEDALGADRRERAIVDREQDVVTREARLQERERELEQRAAEPDAVRLEQIEARLAELRDAEKLFLRTRDELAARSEAVAARERLVSQKERELDDREDGVGKWAGPELTEMEARLRRLEQQQPGEQTLGFSGGLRKLQDGTTRAQRDA